jgi:hypothetical protein
MARVGYTKICHEIGSKLLNCTVSESYRFITDLNEASKAYKELEDDCKNLMKRYQEEALHDADLKEAKKNA